MSYNVLWIDDDYKIQKDFIGQAEQEDIDIFPFESHEEGIADLIKRTDFYHAVILDAKVKKGKNDTVTGLAGLTASRDKLIEINKDGYLPYFIFTGQPDYVDAAWFSESFGRYFIKAKDNDVLFQAIKDEVDNKEEFILAKEYKQAFDVCTESYIGIDNQKHLMQILKSIRNPNEKFDDELYFTQLRIILESLFRYANKIGLLHNKCLEGGNVNLSESSLFLSGLPTKHLGVSCKKSHFSKIISESVKSILFITGAASHTVAPEIKNNINLIEYREALNTPYLLYSLTFQLMDILIWFKKYADENPDKDKNKLLWLPVEETIGVWKDGIVVNLNNDKGFAFFKPNNGSSNTFILPSTVTEHCLSNDDKISVIVEEYVDTKSNETKTRVKSLKKI